MSVCRRPGAPYYGALATPLNISLAVEVPGNLVDITADDSNLVSLELSSDFCF